MESKQTFALFAEASKRRAVLCVLACGAERVLLLWVASFGCTVLGAASVTGASGQIDVAIFVGVRHSRKSVVPFLPPWKHCREARIEYRMLQSASKDPFFLASGGVAHAGFCGGSSSAWGPRCTVVVVVGYGRSAGGAVGGSEARQQQRRRPAGVCLLDNSSSPDDDEREQAAATNLSVVNCEISIEYIYTHTHDPNSHPRPPAPTLHHTTQSTDPHPTYHPPLRQICACSPSSPPSAAPRPSWPL